MRRTVILACAVAVLAPGAASAAVPVTRHHAGESRVAMVARAEARRWPAQQRAALRSLGPVTIFSNSKAAGHARPAIATDLTQYASLMSAGDLTGDGRADVLDLRQSPYRPNTGTLGITARDGRSGRPLWHRTLTESNGADITATVEPLGANGKPSILTVEFFQTFSSNTLVSGTVRLQALSGRNGGVLWTRTLTGTYSAADSESDVPTFDGMIHDAKGPTSDILVSEASTVASPSGYEVTPVVVSGVDGALHEPGSGFTSDENYPDLASIPDVNGDGLGDILALVPGAPGFEQAETGRTGTLIWKTSVAPVSLLGAAVTVIGPYSHRSYPDLAIESFLPAPPAEEVTAVEGRTGQLLWTEPDASVDLLGTAGPHHVPAVAVVTDANSSTTSTFTIGIEDQALTAAGQVLYSRTVSLSLNKPTNATSLGGSTDVERFGDVEPDGSAELYVNLDIEATGTGVNITRSLTGYIDGRTSAFRKVMFDTGADGSLRKGKGTDLLGLTLVKGTPHLSAFSGTTLRRYYARAVPGLNGIQAAWVNGLRVSAHSCSDISLATNSGTHEVLGVLSARGRWLWRVRFTQSQPTGGMLIRSPPPKRFCE